MNFKQLASNKYNELETTGSTRLYSHEGFDLRELLNSFDIMFDPEFYSFGLIENRSGEFIEIIKLTEE